MPATHTRILALSLMARTSAFRTCLAGKIETTSACRQAMIPAQVDSGDDSFSPWHSALRRSAVLTEQNRGFLNSWPALVPPDRSSSMV
jgi:hypothetical protein